ncbi:MAG: carbon-nitrogen hydrolase family protein [Spirochaetia bacterium]|nr:carbon-nitrogen hydrolase family protein [Spirochaetia bacterium]
MQKSFELLTVQSHLPVGKVQENLARIDELVSSIDRKSISGTPLVLLPELAPSGYDPVYAATRCAEEQDGPSFHRLSRLAAAQRLYLACGYAEQGSGGRIYNSLMLIGPDGGRVANYRKLHLTKGEMELFTPGDEVVVAETELGRLGLMICWDLAFPELSRMLTMRGAQLLLAPIAWDTPHAETCRRFARSRALDNTVFLATCNHIGVSSGVSYFGESSIYGPNGDLLSDAGADRETVLRHRVELDQITSMREGYFTMLEDRRTDLYC